MKRLSPVLGLVCALLPAPAFGQLMESTLSMALTAKITVPNPKGGTKVASVRLTTRDLVEELQENLSLVVSKASVVVVRDPIAAPSVPALFLVRGLQYHQVPVFSETPIDPSRHASARTITLDRFGSPSQIRYEELTWIEIADSGFDMALAGMESGAYVLIPLNGSLVDRYSSSSFKVVGSMLLDDVRDPLLISGTLKIGAERVR